MGGQACGQWPCSFLAWGLRPVHGWEKVPLALGPRGRRRRRRKGQGISPGAKRGAGCRDWEPPAHVLQVPLNTHTHTLRHKSTHGHTQTHLHTHSLLPVHTHAHPYIHKDTHAHSYTHVTLTPSVWIHVEAPTCSHICTQSHTHGYTHTRVDRHMHVHIDSHTCTHMYTQCHASGDLKLRSDTHTAQEAMVGRLRPGWHLGEKQAQVKDLSPLRGSRERVCREVEAGRRG